MDRDRFEALVIALAADGLPITVANVSARSGVAPRKAEAMLDDMVRAHHLESDVDEREAVIVYRVRGLSANVSGSVKKRVAGPTVGSMASDAHDRVVRAAGEVVVRQAASRARAAVLAPTRDGEKSVVYGALFGLLGPIGLAYAAPWMTVVLGTLVYAIAWKIPVVHSIVAMLAVLIHLACALLGAAYAWRYNRGGRRAPLLTPEAATRLPR